MNKQLVQLAAQTHMVFLEILLACSRSTFPHSGPKRPRFLNSSSCCRFTKDCFLRGCVVLKNMMASISLLAEMPATLSTTWGTCDGNVSLAKRTVNNILVLGKQGQPETPKLRSGALCSGLEDLLAPSLFARGESVKEGHCEKVEVRP